MTACAWAKLLFSNGFRQHIPGGHSRVASSFEAGRPFNKNVPTDYILGDTCLGRSLEILAGLAVGRQRTDFRAAFQLSGRESLSSLSGRILPLNLRVGFNMSRSLPAGNGIE